MQTQQRFVADQRYDLPLHENMMELISSHFRNYNKEFFTSKNYVVKNWKIESAGGLKVRVNNATDSLLVLSELTGKEEMIYREAGATVLEVNLVDNATNYVEVEFDDTTTAEDSVALWDSTANAGEGEEYIQNVDTVQCLGPKLVSNTFAFSVADKSRVRLATVVTSGGSIVSVNDFREFFFHLESDWVFGSPRTDTGIGDIKSDSDAIKTIIKELKGASTGWITAWYDLPGVSPLDNLERMNYIMVDGGSISWDLPKPARGSLVCQHAHPVSGYKDGDTLTIYGVTFEVDTDGSSPSNPITVAADADAATVKTAVLAAIAASPLTVTATSGDGNRINIVNNVNGTAGNVAITEVCQNAAAGVSFGANGMDGGFDNTELTWTDIIRIIVPGRAFTYNIAAQTVSSLADGEVAYVTLPAVGVSPGGVLPVSKVSASAYVISNVAARNYIIACRSGSKIYFGNGWMTVELEDGETSQLGDGVSNEWLIATGLTSEYDSTPPYYSNYFITPETSFTKAISELDIATKSLWDMTMGKIYNEQLVSDGTAAYQAGAYLSLPPAFGIGPNQTYQTDYNQLEIYFNGDKVEKDEDYYEDANVGAGIGNRIQLIYDLPLDTKIVFRIQAGGGQEGTVGTNAPDVYDEGALVESLVGKFNFVGAGVRVTSPAPDEVDILIKYPRELGKLIKNDTGVTIPLNSVVAWLDDGTMELADADDVSVDDIIGITGEAVLDGNFGLVLREGDIPGAVTGLGAVPGQAVYLSKTPGQLTLTKPTTPGDRVIRMGRAEPADGVSSATCTDLWLHPIEDVNVGSLPNYEVVDVLSGTSIIDAVALTWDASGSVYDILVFINGDFIAPDEYTKTTTSRLTFSYTIMAGAKVVIWKQGGGVI